MVPPSIHPTGTEYVFERPLNGNLTAIDIGELMGPSADNQVKQAEVSAAPSDFALCYGKSPYPQSLCGRATKVLTRSDGKMKRLLSLRCWKWHCPKCAPLLKRYWLPKLGGVSFRFILRLPTMDKPVAFLSHVGKPGYVHILGNGESWLFLTDGDADRVWSEARQVGYELIAGDISGDPCEVGDCLDHVATNAPLLCTSRERPKTGATELLHLTILTLCYNGTGESPMSHRSSMTSLDLTTLYSDHSFMWCHHLDRRIQIRKQNLKCLLILGE